MLVSSQTSVAEVLIFGLTNVRIFRMDSLLLISSIMPIAFSLTCDLESPEVINYLT